MILEDVKEKIMLNYDQLKCPICDDRLEAYDHLYICWTCLKVYRELSK